VAEVLEAAECWSSRGRDPLRTYGAVFGEYCPGHIRPVSCFHGSTCDKVTSLRMIGRYEIKMGPYDGSGGISKSVTHKDEKKEKEEEDRVRSEQDV